MKKYLVSFLALAAFGLYLAFNNQNVATVAPAAPAATTETPTGAIKNPDSGNTAAGSSKQSLGNASGGSTRAGSGGAAGNYRNGTYTGKVADAIFGQLQVKIAVQNGKIADVAYPQYPNESVRTREVSAMALPILREEAIAAQSANVDIVSGATQTSEAFQQTLASALAQAKA